MSALDKLTEARKLIIGKFGNLTGDDEQELERWAKNIKKYESYKRLRENPAFRDFLKEIKGALSGAITTINNRESEAKSRDDAFVMRDCMLFILDLFDEKVEKTLEHIEQEISGRMAIVEKDSNTFKRVL